MLHKSTSFHISFTFRLPFVPLIPTIRLQLPRRFPPKLSNFELGQNSSLLSYSIRWKWFLHYKRKREEFHYQRGSVNRKQNCLPGRSWTRQSVLVVHLLLCCFFGLSCMWYYYIVIYVKKEDLELKNCVTMSVYPSSTSLPRAFNLSVSDLDYILIISFIVYQKYWLWSLYFMISSTIYMCWFYILL